MSTFYTNRNRLLRDHFSGIYDLTIRGAENYDLLSPAIGDDYTYHDQILDVRKKWKDRRNPSCVFHVSIKKTRAQARSFGYAWSASDVTVNQLPIVVDPSWLATNVPVPDEALLRNFCLDAMDEMGTQVPTEVSILNFGWELRELATLIPRMSANLVSGTAGHVLNYKFGWEPFLRDLLAFGGILNRVQSRIKFLKDTWGKRTRIGSYRGNVWHPTVPADLTFGDPNLGTKGVMAEFDLPVKSYRCDFRATGYLFHTLEHLDGIDGLIRGCFAALGLNHPTQVFWDALPFSFVVDWFLKVGDRLRPLALDPYPGTFVVQDITCSVKQKWMFDLTQKSRPLGSGGQPWSTATTNKIGEVEMTFYRRYNYFPTRWLDITEPTPNQLMLLACLMAAS